MSRAKRHKHGRRKLSPAKLARLRRVVARDLDSHDYERQSYAVAVDGKRAAVVPQEQVR